MTEKEQGAKDPEEIIKFLKEHYPPKASPPSQALQRLIDAQHASVSEKEGE